MKKLIFVLIFGSFVASQLYGLDFGYNFIKLPKSPWESVTGYGFVVFEEDGFAPLANPALKSHSSYSFSGTSYLADVKYGAVSADVKGITAGLLFVSSGKMTKMDESGIELGDFSANFVNLKAAKTLEFRKDMRLGVGAGILYQGIDDEMSLAIAADFGVRYTPMPKLLLGASLRNVGFELKSIGSDRIMPPLTATLGAAFSPFNGFVLYGGAEFSPDYPFAVSVAAKFTVERHLELGFGFNSKGTDWRIGKESDILAGMNFGLVVHVSKFDLTYSFSPMGSIGSIHRIGVSMR